METRNSKTLRSFIRYCVTHPEERFWQAIRNWSEYNKIVGVTIDWKKVPEPNPLMESGYTEYHINTFNLEGRRHDEES